jgi:menaquinone-9 beta-reductase
MTTQFDVAVVGGGPAGTAAAITAARAGRSVLLLDKSRFPRNKVCGEFVSAESVALLRSLLGEHTSALMDSPPRISHADLFLQGRTLRIPISPPAVSISRFALDHALWHTASAAGVEAREQVTVLGVEDAGEGLLVRASNAEFRARAVINAGGRWSELSRYSADDGWIGLKAHFTEAQPRPGVQLYFFTDGYCGVQPAGAGEINVCGMVTARSARRLHELLGLEPGLKARSRTWQQSTETVTTFPLVFRRETPVRGKVINVGDAAAFVDPFIGDGISIALQTGALAGRLLCSAVDAETAAERYARAYYTSVSPVLRRAAQLRRLIQERKVFGSVASMAMRSPWISGWAVNTTRARLRLDLRNTV